MSKIYTVINPKTNVEILITDKELQIIDFLQKENILTKTVWDLCRDVKLPMSGLQSILRTMRQRKILEYRKGFTESAGNKPDIINQVVSKNFLNLIKDMDYKIFQSLIISMISVIPYSMSRDTRDYQ